MVIYFSGNGNSEFVALSIASKLECDAVKLHGDLLHHPDENELTDTDNNIVWVFPVYSWGIPPVVENFMKHCKINFTPTAIHHLVVTCGDDTGLVADQWRKLCRARGWVTGCTSSVIMPNTYVLMKGFDTDTKQIEQQKLNDAPATINAIVKRISDNCTGNDVMTTGKFAWLKSRVIYPWFIRHAMSPKPFHYTEQCIGCGKCARECPMNNITMVDDKPKWNNHCALCLRCYHRCPVNAVAYGKATVGKHQYKGPKD